MQLNLEPTLTLDTQYRFPKLFIVIGAGGTGGYLIPNLARQLSITNKIRNMEGHLPHRLLIVDADTVGLSNLNRQNFIEKDLNRNKAEVLATRYGNAFQVHIEFLPEYITSTKRLLDLLTSLQPSTAIHVPVLVDCVDNNKTRVFIEETFRNQHSHESIFSLSSGNEFLNGQVVCGFENIPFVEDQPLVHEGLFRLPSVVDMFPEILKGEDKLPTELSCDEAAVSHPQNIMTNITAANHLFTFANILMTAKLENAELPGLKHFAVTFDTQQGTARTFLNKKSVIESFLVKTKEQPTSDMDYSSPVGALLS